MGNDTHSLPQAAIDAISVRLAALPDLRLPAQLRSGASEQRKKEYLQALLLHDPGERRVGIAHEKATRVLNFLRWETAAGTVRAGQGLPTLSLSFRSPGVFLERHGSSLSASERKLFHPLRGDYEASGGPRRCVWPCLVCPLRACAMRRCSPLRGPRS